MNMTVFDTKYSSTVSMEIPDLYTAARPPILNEDNSHSCSICHCGCCCAQCVCSAARTDRNAGKSNGDSSYAGERGLLTTNTTATGDMVPDQHGNCDPETTSLIAFIMRSDVNGDDNNDDNNNDDDDIDDDNIKDTDDNSNIGNEDSRNYSIQGSYLPPYNFYRHPHFSLPQPPTPEEQEAYNFSRLRAWLSTSTASSPFAKSQHDLSITLADLSSSPPESLSASMVVQRDMASSSVFSLRDSGRKGRSEMLGSSCHGSFAVRGVGGWVAPRGYGEILRETGRRGLGSGGWVVVN